MNTTSTIVMSMVVGTSATIMREVVNKRSPEPRVIIGGFIVGAILLAVAEFWEEPARLLALLIALTSLLTNGDVVFGSLNRIVGGESR